MLGARGAVGCPRLEVERPMGPRCRCRALSRRPRCGPSGAPVTEVITRRCREISRMPPVITGTASRNERACLPLTGEGVPPLANQGIYPGFGKVTITFRVWGKPVTCEKRLCFISDVGKCGARVSLPPASLPCSLPRHLSQVCVCLLPGVHTLPRAPVARPAFSGGVLGTQWCGRGLLCTLSDPMAP